MLILKRVLCNTFFIVILVSTPAFVLAESTVDNFLLRSLDDVRHFQVDPQTSKRHSLNLWLNNAEFRLNVDRDLGDDENTNTYEVRLKPKPFGQYSAEKKILELHLTREDYRYDKLLSNALYQRYFFLIDVIEKGNEQRYFLAYLNLLKEETRFYRGLAQSKDFRAGKLLESELSLEEAQVLADMNAEQLRSIQKKTGLSNDEVIAQGALSSLVSFSDIVKTMNQSPSPEQNPDTLEARLDLKLKESLNQSNMAQQKLGIDLLTFQYKEDRKEDAIAFTIGVNLPIGDSFNTSESMSDIRVAESKLVNQVVLAERLTALHRDQLYFLSLKQTSLNDRIQKIGDRIRKPFALNDPELLFTLKHEQIRQMRELVRNSLKAIRIHVDSLNRSGRLVQQPLRNWIRNGYPELLGS